MLSISPSVHFQGQPRQKREQQVKQAAETLQKVLPMAPMVQGTLVSGKPQIFIGVPTQAVMNTVKGILAKTPHVTQSPADLSWKYRQYPIQLFDGISRL
jgi:hypothetical protein